MTCALLLTVVGVVVIFDFLHWRFKVHFSKLFICSISRYMFEFTMNERKKENDHWDWNLFWTC